MFILSERDFVTLAYSEYIYFYISYITFTYTWYIYYIYIYIYFLHFYACFLYCWKPSVYPQPIFSQSYISIPPEISEKRKEHINATLITARNIAKVKKIYWYVFVTGIFFCFFVFVFLKWFRILFRKS